MFFVSKLIDQGNPQEEVIDYALSEYKKLFPEAQIKQTSISILLVFKIENATAYAKSRDYTSKNSRVVNRQYTKDYTEIKQAGQELGKTVSPKIRKVVSDLKKKYKFAYSDIVRKIREKDTPPTLEYDVNLMLAD